MEGHQRSIDIDFNISGLSRRKRCQVYIRGEMRYTTHADGRAVYGDDDGFCLLRTSELRCNHDGRITDLKGPGKLEG